MKSEKLPRRLIAYAIDMLIFAAIALIVTSFIKESNNVKVLNLEMNSINELALNHDIKISTYLTRYASIMQELDKEKVLINVLNCIFIMVYFVFIPYFFEGRTIGKKIMKLKVVRRDGELLMLNDLVIRNLIINGLGFLLISLCMLYVVPSIAYLILTILLGILQIIVVFISVFMVIYRHDHRGLHDIISDTKVVRE